MKKKSRKKNQISRRFVLSIIGSSLFIPFFGFGNSYDKKSVPSNNNEEYQTLLKPNGTIVKVKISALKRSKIVKRNLNNKSFLHWLNKKD